MGPTILKIGLYLRRHDRSDLLIKINKMSQVPSKPKVNSQIRTVIITVVCFSLIYFLYYVRQFLRGDIVMGGDTQLLWSFNYLSFLSLKEYGEFLWWDPTASGGWPAYVNLTSGWFNYFGPYTLPAMAMFVLGNFFGNIDINSFLVLQKTLYYFVLNLLALVLISREVIKSPLARLLPPLIFTLSAIQFHGFRDSVLYEVLPAPLFFVFGLIFYARRQTQGAFFLLLLFAALFIANANYGVLQTSLWWTGSFTLFLLLFQPTLLPAAARSFTAAWGATDSRPVLIMLLVLMLAAGAAFYLPVHFNLGEVVRVSGSEVINYDVGVYGGFHGRDGYTVAALSHPVWSNMLYWAPFEVIHDYFLQFDAKSGGAKAGVDHRYIGLATLPLLCAAIFLGFRRKYVFIFLLTAFACSAFIAYASRNLLVSSFAETFPLFRNIRTVADTLPRDGPIIFLALTAGIGLDCLLEKVKTAAKDGDVFLMRIFRWSIVAILVFAVTCLLASLVPVSPYTQAIIVLMLGKAKDLQLPELKEAFAHIGVYLLLFGALALMLSAANNIRYKRNMAMVMLLLVFFDMTISSTIYWKRSNVVWFQNDGPHALPRVQQLLPVDSTLQTWLGSNAGFIHNPFAGPFIGLRTWLPLATRPAWQPALENWDADLRIMKAYPAFRFYSGARYVPFESIMDIDALKRPADETGALYVHDRQLAKTPIRKIEAKVELLGFTPNRVKVRVNMPESGLMVFLDNHDRFWSVRIDGVSAPIYRANFTFKAVSLAAGEHLVEWEYDPLVIKLAWGFFYLLLIVVAMMLLGMRLRRSLIIGSAVFSVFFVVVLNMGGRSGGDASAHGSHSTGNSGVTGVIESGRLKLDGGDYPIGEGLAGYVEGVFADETGLIKLIGWAIDEQASRPMSRVVVTVNGKVWIVGRLTHERPDIMAMSPGYRYSGFQIYGRGAQPEHLEMIKVYGITSNGRALELRYSKGVKHDSGKKDP